MSTKSRRNDYRRQLDQASLTIAVLISEKRGERQRTDFAIQRLVRVLWPDGGVQHNEGTDIVTSMERIRRRILEVLDENDSLKRQLDEATGPFSDLGRPTY